MSTYQKVSSSPTNPRAPGASPGFDVALLLGGPAGSAPSTGTPTSDLAEKTRQAYFWMVNTAIISPFYDLEYDDGPSSSVRVGDSKVLVRLPSGQSYSSFCLLPLLNLVTRRRLLFVGGPGRGKTASAVLMGVLAGYSMSELRRAIQHGQPQMTIADLLGNPLPGDLVNAKSMEEVRIAWRKWLGMRVKIIDEYNRIPTRTQSALLTVMADNYAELLDQVYECPDAAWYLTANDDAGGGTYDVIEALRDRIDIVVKALHFNSRFLGALLTRIEDRVRPEDVVPKEITFSESELAEAEAQVLRVQVPHEVRRRIEMFAASFELCEPAAQKLEYLTKDTVKLAGGDVGQLMSKESGKDKRRDIGAQTTNGLSVRALMTTLVFAKAIAWFRGSGAVTLEDVRQILPFVLHDKLTPNVDSPFFEEPANLALRTDRVSWIRALFDAACAEYDRLDLDRKDDVHALLAELDLGLEGLTAHTVRERIARVERTLKTFADGRKLYGAMYDDVLALKYLHQRYTNYLRWLEWQGR